MKAITIGSGLGILGSTISALIVAFFVAGVTSSPVVFVGGFVLELGSSVLGGFAAGLIAKRLELSHAAAAGVPCILIGIFLYHPAGRGPYAYPPWYNVASYALIIPGAVLGGYFARLKHRCQTPDVNTGAEAARFGRAAGRLRYSIDDLFAVPRNVFGRIK